MIKRRAGEDLIAGLREAVAFERGHPPAGVRVRRVPRTARDTTVAAPKNYSPSQIARVRASLKLSQQVFADALNVSAETVRAWEQGKRTPDGAALRLLEFTEKRPALLLSVLQVR